LIFVAETYRTIEQYEQALRETGGLLALAARKLGLTYQAVHKRVNESPRLQALVKQCREELADTAEAKLKQAVLNGESWAVDKVLKSLRREIYGDKVQHTGEGGGAIKIEVVYRDENG
jgi:hypothetical protein